MQIHSLTFRGVKGTSREISVLPRRVLLRGAAGTGKSAVLEAFRVAAVGCSPALGLDAAATARMLPDSADSMGVAVSLSDGRAWSRLVVRDGKRVRSEARALWLPPEATSTECHDAIVRLFGAAEEEARQHLDIRALLAAPPGERTRYVAALLETPGDLDRILSRVRALAWRRAAGSERKSIPPGDTLGLVEFIRAHELTREAGDALAAVEEAVLTVLRGQGLAAALQTARAAKADAEAAARSKVAARAEIEARAASARKARPGARLEDLRRERQELDQTLGRLQGELAAARRSAEAVSAATLGVERAQEALDVARRGAEEVPSMLAEADAAARDAEAIIDPPAPSAPEPVQMDPAAVAEADRLEAEARAFVLPPLPTNREVMATSTRLDAAKAALAVRSADLFRAQTGLNGAQRDYEVYKQQPTTAILAIAGDMRFVVREWTPAVDDQSAWGVRAQMIAHIGRLDAELSDVPRPEHHETIIAEARRIHDAAAEAVKQAEKELEVATRVHDDEAKKHANDERVALDARTRLAAMLAEATRIRSEASAAAAAESANRLRLHARELDAHRAAVKANFVRRNGLSSTAALLKTNAHDRTKKVESAERALALAQSVLDTERKQQTRDPAVIEAEWLAARQVATGVAEDLMALEAAAARSSEMSALALGIAEADARSAASGAYLWALDVVRKEELESMGGPVVARMTAFLRACGRTETPYLRASRSGPELGWKRGDDEIGLETLSGAESTLFLAGLAGVVIEIRRPEVRALLIDADRLGADGEMLLAMLRGLATLEMDNVVVASPPSLRVQPNDDWFVLELGS